MQGTELARQVAADTASRAARFTEQAGRPAVPGDGAGRRRPGLGHLRADEAEPVPAGAPGGVGPMTIAVLLAQTVDAAVAQAAS